MYQWEAILHVTLQTEHVMKLKLISVLHYYRNFTVRMPSLYIAAGGGVLATLLPSKYNGTPY